MGWKKYWTTVSMDDNMAGMYSPVAGQNNRGQQGSSAGIGYRNYQSQLPEVYKGHPNRTERYQQYEFMDMDSEVNAALDIMAEFCTQPNVENGTAFDLYFKEEPTQTEIEILKDQLQRWYTINDFNKRIFKLFRNVLKYGDQVFIRDPETYEMYWVDMAKVTKVIVNESKGKEPEYYVVKDISPNFQNLSVNTPAYSDEYTVSPSAGGGVGGAYIMPNTPYTGGSRFQQAQNEVSIESKNIIHTSLTEGLDLNWPFGQSILEQIFKTYKQKELLEDAIIIYRVQRAPERRVFYIDTGSMPNHIAMAHVERIKNEVYQRRIPTQNGGGTTMMDATYNPLSINEDYFLPQSADGRGSKIDTLQGGANLGEIDDLRYFTNKMFRGLRIPSSYLPTGPDDSTATHNDGRLGTALIQEYRFNQYCIRLQNLVASTLDVEFKSFVKNSSYELDNSMFELRFNEPQNFASYRQAELDNTRISTFVTLDGIPYMAKRFIRQRFLGMSEEEMADNDRMWKEEQGLTEDENVLGDALRGVGVTPGGIDGDLESIGMPEEGDEDFEDLEGDMDALGTPDPDAIDIPEI